jgi:hypothetical protein
MSRLTCLVLVAPLLLSGCVTRCWTELIYKPEVTDSALSVSTYSGKVVIKNLAAGVDVEVFECGFVYRREDNGPVSICLSIANPEKAQVVFLDQTLRFSAADGATLKNSKLGLSEPDTSKPNAIFYNGSFPVTSSEKITVQLPTIEINGSKILLPPIKFRRVTESRCGSFA